MSTFSQIPKRLLTPPGTATEMRPFVGKKGWIRARDLEVEIQCLDVKQVWGQTRYLVTPVAGQGSVWVNDVTWREESSR